MDTCTSLGSSYAAGASVKVECDNTTVTTVTHYDSATCAGAKYV